jgi:hypothetical protein
VKALTLWPALGIMLASPVAAYAIGKPYGQVHRHRTIHHAMRDPFKPRTTHELSRNRNACASYGCVVAGGGGDW